MEYVKDDPDNKTNSPLARRDNVSGAFRFNGNLNGRNIILLDDIFTTGATVEECINELKMKGAGNVTVLTLAITQLKLDLSYNSEVLNQLNRQYKLRFSSKILRPFYSDQTPGSQDVKDYDKYCTELEVALTNEVLDLQLGNNDFDFDIYDENEVSF